MAFKNPLNLITNAANLCECALWIKDIVNKTGMCGRGVKTHEPAFFCFSLMKSEQVWLHTEQLRFEIFSSFISLMTKNQMKPADGKFSTFPCQVVSVFLVPRLSFIISYHCMFHLCSMMVHFILMQACTDFFMFTFCPLAFVSV